MWSALHWVLFLILCALFIIISDLSNSRVVAAENYERAHRMHDNVVDASGFISIDCGSSRDYIDEETGIHYQTDKNFIETGNNYMVPSDVYSDIPYLGKQLATIRCFPNGDRNCYTLRPEQSKNKNSRYLIGAFFSYGNYDGKNQTPSFDLHFGVNPWMTISLIPASGYLYAEVIYTPLSSESIIQVCLVKTGPTIPCISSLELRPLNSSIFSVMSNTNPQPLLNLQTRIDVSSLTWPLFSRYKDDIYDRIWRNYHNVTSWFPLELDNSTNIDPGTKFDAYKLPAQVLRTAAQSRNVSYALEFDFNSLFKDLPKTMECYVYFHFAEIEKLPDGKKRIINITLNSKNILSQPLVLEYLKPVTINYSTKVNVDFSISAASESDAPPILNAFEVYNLITELDSPTDARDVGALVDIKSAYEISRLNWQGDPCLPTQYAWQGLICSSDSNPRIKSLNLSSSKLKGEINTAFSYLTELEVLDLSNNELEGSLPQFLAEFPKLKVINLNGNNLSGLIPKALKEKADTSLQLSVANNPNLCVTDSCDDKKNFVVPLVASLSALIVILSISLGLWIFKRRRKVEANTYSKKRGSWESKHRAFSYNEILNITENFKTIIGEGGFGKVYLGALCDNAQVAVKLLSLSSRQGYKEFRSEAQLLSLVHHRNLVSLIGYSDEGKIKALIYEYMENGNLHQHLSDKSPNVLKWNERLIIALDAANGLDYLHNGCKPPIVHRDLKTSNILLDQSNHAKIADFGLSRAFGDDVDSHISTRPAGTPGYMDPEFQRTGNSNKKSDVYSFGIILLELITGQPALGRASSGKMIQILQRVTPIVERGDIQNIVDPRLEGEFNTNSAWKLVEIAFSCTSQIADERPDMSQILAELKECLSLEMVGITPEIPLMLETEFAPLAR